MTEENLVTNSEPTASESSSESTIKSGLRDVLDHTFGLGFISMIRVDVGDNERLGHPATTVFSREPNGQVLINADLDEHWAGSEGVLAFSDLKLLNWVVNASHLDGDVEIIKEHSKKLDAEVPAELKFHGSDGSCQHHRFLHQTLIDRHLDPQRVKDTLPWNATFTPNPEAIAKFSEVSSAIKEFESSVVFEVEDGKLIADFGGDTGNHRGRIVFVENIEGDVDNSYRWGVNFIESILKLALKAPSYQMSIYNTDEKALIRITMDSPHASYQYVISPMA